MGIEEQQVWEDGDLPEREICWGRQVQELAGGGAPAMEGPRRRGEES